MLARRKDKSGRLRYCLVSVKDPSKVLEWYGTQKPSDATIQRSEDRVNWFKNKKR
jgi:hypothetical protein